MAVTQVQQLLADTAQTPMDSEQCCLSMGGVLNSLTDSCELSNQSISLNSSCGYVAQVAMNTPDAVNQQSGGGFGSWIQQNAEGIGTLLGTVGGFFGVGTPPPTPSLNETPGDEGQKTLLAVAVAIIVVVVAILLIRKSRK